MHDNAMKDGRTHILYGVENALSYGKRFMEKAKFKMDITFDHRAPSIVIKIPVYREGYRDIIKRGGKIRCITDITKENIHYCKELLNIVSELRHLEGLKGGIAVTESEYMATTILKEEHPLTEVIYSNAKEVVSQNQYLFDTLWGNAIPAIKKIKEIEDGVEIEFLKVIDNSLQSKYLYIDNLRMSKRELLLLIPLNLVPSIEKDIEIFELIKRLLKDPNIKIKILLYHNLRSRELCQDPTNSLFHQKKNNFLVKYIEKESRFKLLDRTAIVIIDRKISMILELKKDSKSFGNSIIFSIQSNNKIFVTSYIAIFESLWKYTDLCEQLKKAEKKIQIQKENLQKQIDHKTRYLLKINRNLKRINKEFANKEKDLTNTNKELIETESKKDEFISMIAHELRTPLVPIKGYTEMLLKPQLLGTLNRNQEKAIETIYRNVKKQKSLVDDILDIYKLDMGKLKLSKKMVAILNLFTNVINDSKSLLEEKQISIIPKINTTTKNTVYCDVKRIEQVLSNLIKNSVDFVPEKTGKIMLMAEEIIEGKKSWIVINVQDNGIGIPKDKMGNLFKKFYQIDTSATRQHAGTGLGLVICKGIVEAHGGKIWIDDKQSNGCSVMFSLPSS